MTQIIDMLVAAPPDNSIYNGKTHENKKPRNFFHKNEKDCQYNGNYIFVSVHR